MILPPRLSHTLIRVLLVLALGLGPVLTVFENRLLIYAGLLLAAASVLALGRHGLYRMIRLPWVWFVMAIPMLGLAAAPFALHPPTAFSFVPETLLPILAAGCLLLAGANRLTRRHQTLMLWSTAGGLAVAALLALFMRTTMDAASCSRLWYAVLGPENCPIFSDLNQTDCILAVLIWPVLVGFWRQRQRWAALGLFVLISFTILTGHSQSAMLGLVLASLSLGLGLLVGPRRMLIAVTAAMLLLLLFLPLLMPLAIDQARDRGLLAHVPDSAVHRVAIWEEATQLIAERPLIGWGLNNSRRIGDHFGTFDLEIDRGADLPPLIVVDTQRIPTHPHNASLEWWLDLGLVGVVAIAAVLLLGLWRARNALIGPGAFATLGALVGAYAISQTAYGVWQPWWLTALFITIMVVRAVSLRADERGYPGTTPTPTAS